MSEKRKPVEILRENFSKIEFECFQFDDNLDLDDETRALLTDFYIEYYYRQNTANRKKSPKKRRRFERTYQMHPEDFPPLIHPMTVSIQNLGETAPGNSLDYRLLTGYFKRTKDPQGCDFMNPFDHPIRELKRPLLFVAKALKHFLDEMDKESENYLSISPYYRDMTHLSDALDFIVELYHYRKQNKFRPLKSGHFISFVSGFNRFCTELEKATASAGLMGITLEDSTPFSSRIKSLREQAHTALMDFTLDLIEPIARSESLELVFEKGKLEVYSLLPEPKGFIADWFDFILTLLGIRKKRPLPMEESPNPSCRIPGSDEEESDSAPKKKAKMIDSFPYQTVYGKLKEFKERLVEELAPVLDGRGQISDYRGMFDQFHLESERRDISTKHHILHGKGTGGNPNNPRYQDTMVICSTYWVYDRVKSILDCYDLSANQVEMSVAAYFLEEVRQLLFSSKERSNEMEYFGNFYQFRINVRRLFATNKQINIFNHLMNQISEYYDEAKAEYVKAEAKAKTPNAKK